MPCLLHTGGLLFCLLRHGGLLLRLLRTGMFLLCLRCRGGLLPCLLCTGRFLLCLFRRGGLLLRLLCTGGLLLCLLCRGRLLPCLLCTAGLLLRPGGRLEVAPWGGLCHKSGLCTSIHSPPEVTHSPHGLLRYTTLHYTTLLLHFTSDNNSHHPLH